MWDLPGPGLEPVSPALAGGFLTTAPPEKPRIFPFIFGFQHFDCDVSGYGSLCIFPTFEFVMLLGCVFIFLFYVFGCSPTRDLTACRILVPQPGIEPVPPAVEVQSPNHWTTGEVLDVYF